MEIAATILMIMQYHVPRVERSFGQSGDTRAASPGAA